MVLNESDTIKSCHFILTISPYDEAVLSAQSRGTGTVAEARKQMCFSPGWHDRAGKSWVSAVLQAPVALQACLPSTSREKCLNFAFGGTLLILGIHSQSFLPKPHYR